MSEGGEFESFVDEVRPRLARAFVAAYGVERGQEALAEALGYAWEHFGNLRTMANPAGYLYRVGQSRSRGRRQATVLPAPASVGLPDIEPQLPGALLELSERQRVCVVLVVGYEWTHQEVADLIGLSRSSVQNHVERAVGRLRNSIGVTRDAN